MMLWVLCVSLGCRGPLAVTAEAGADWLMLVACNCMLCQWKLYPNRYPEAPLRHPNWKYGLIFCASNLNLTKMK